MNKLKIDRKIVAGLFISVTIILTWILQFMPMMLGLDISETSVSSFDFASLFFTLGGMMPTLIGVIFVLVFYSKKGIIAFIKKCFVPNKECLYTIPLALGLVCFEVLITQLVTKTFGGEDLGFEGLKIIFSNPLYIFYFLFWGLISGPLSEEVGWRGFLLDQLFSKKKLFLVSLFIGFIWGIWHLPLYFYPAQIQYEWVNTNFLLGIGFIVSTMSASLVYNSIYVLSKRKVFPIFFLHMFKNIILTGAMIYPFSFTYKICVVPCEIILDLIFYFIISNTKLYKNALNSLDEENYLKSNNKEVIEENK